MKSLLHLILGLVIILSQTSAAKAPSPAESAQAQRLLRFQVSAAFTSEYATLAEALKGFADFGLISVTEKMAIEEFLAKQKIDLERKLMKPTLAGPTLKWRNKSVMLQSDGSLKTEAGQFLRYEPGMSADAVFIKTYQTLMPKRAAVWRELSPFPEATADEMEDRAVGASVLSMYYHAGFFTKVICGGFAVPADYIVHKVSSYLNPRFKIYCDGDKYGMADDNPYSEQLEHAFKHVTQWHSNPDSATLSDASSEALCGVPLWHAIGWDQDRGRYDKLPEDALKKYVEGPCTPDKAVKATALAKADASKASLAIRDMLLDHKSTIEPGKDTTIQR